MLDVDAIVQTLLEVKEKNIQMLNTEKAIYQAKAASLSNLLGSLNDAKSFFEDLDVDSLFTGKKVNISDSDILSATATDETPNITLDINVVQLAQSEIRVSTDGVTDLEDSISSGTFTLKYWTSDTEYESYTIEFGGGTLEDLVDAINEAQDKVTASIYYDGTYYKLMLSEKDVGNSTKETSSDSAVIEISGSFPLSDLETLQNAQNAEIQLGDSSSYVTSATNTFNNLVTGLNVTVNNTGEAQITVEDDYSDAKDKLNDLFDKVNAIVDLVNSMTGKGDIFQGNAAIVEINSKIFNSLSPLINLGLVNLSEEGVYSLNEETFNELTSDNLEELENAVSQVKENFEDMLEVLTESLQTYKESQDDQIERIDEEIEELQTSLKEEEERLRLEFSKIELLMYHNEQLKTRLKSLAIPLSEMTKSS
jgi:flagellar hook-associated protein 2